MTVLNRKQVIERLKSGEVLKESGNTYIFADGKSCSGATDIWLRENNLVKVYGDIGREVISWDFIVKDKVIKNKVALTDSEKRELTEKHWKYTEGLLKTLGKIPTELEHIYTCRVFYTDLSMGRKTNEIIRLFCNSNTYNNRFNIIWYI